MLGGDPKYAASVQDLIKSKDLDIQALKKRLKIPNLEHVQTPELQVVQQEKEQLLAIMSEMNRKMENYEKQIEVLTKERMEHLFRVFISTNNPCRFI